MSYNRNVPFSVLVWPHLVTNAQSPFAASRNISRDTIFVRKSLPNQALQSSVSWALHVVTCVCAIMPLLHTYVLASKSWRSSCSHFFPDHRFIAGSQVST